MKKYELMPNDGHKSFYKKAIVMENDNGDKILLSYGTPVIELTSDGQLFRLWGGWSATTGRHIKAFCGLNKAAFTAMQTERRF